MANMKELMERGNQLAEKHDIGTLKDSLKDAIAMGDGEERLALQWALKQKTQTTDGHAFTKEQETKMSAKLSV